MTEPKILWKGRPRQGVILGVEALTVVPALYFVVLAVMLTPRLFHGSNWLLSPLVLVLVWVAYLVSIGRFKRDKQRRSETRYEVTEDRIIVRRKPSFLVDAVQSASIDMVPNVVVQEHSDGTGTLYFLDKSFTPKFGKPLRPRPFSKYLPVNGNFRDLGMCLVFERIAEYQQVKALVDSLRTRHYSTADAVIHGQQNVTV